MNANTPATASPQVPDYLRMKSPEELHDILTKLRRGLEALYEDRLEGLYLYGSYARGDARPGSDLDKARRAIDAARRDLDAGEPEFAAGHTYYAMFYTAEALIATRDLTFSSSPSPCRGSESRRLQNGRIESGHVARRL